MKIGIIAHDAHPICEPFEGGLEMITYLLVDELVRRGHQVTTLCNEGSQLSGNMVFYLDSQNIGMNKLDRSPLAEFGKFFKSATEFLNNNFDVIHNNSLTHHAIVLGQLCHIPFITSFHTPIFDNLSVGIQAVNKNPNQVFTAVSNSLRRAYEDHLPEVMTIYNGIDLDHWKTAYSKKDYYSWCGRICEEKGLRETMDLCHQNNIKLKFAGPISNSSYFENFIEPRLQSYDNCEYIGHLNQHGINSLLASSKAFIFSSIWEEPYGLVIAEALASGTPVIANDIGAASEIVTNQCGILFNLKSQESFSSALLEINKITSENCRQRAESFCSHKKMVSDYEVLYLSVSESKAVLL